MALAIFDLDNTLLAGDSDYLWGVFLARLGVVDGEFYERENARFYQEYKEGRLDIDEFLRFSLTPLRDNTVDRLETWREQFITEMIEPIILPRGEELIEQHRRTGDTLMIITATNAFVTRPIADRLGIDLLIATEPEFRDGAYTGEIAGIPSFQEGKVKRLQQWLEQTGGSLRGSSFYSDSHNDIALLQRVERPVAVDPDEMLSRHARKQGWEIISLRD